MFGTVKTWLRKWVEEPSADESVTKPMLHHRSPVLPSEQPSSVTAVLAGGMANGGHAARVSGGVTTDSLQLPLAAVFSVLPNDLQSRARLPLDGQALVTVPLAMVFPQLGRGAVKITFAELRQMVPSDIFYSQTDRDQAVVELPLGEILSRLKPEMLPRRVQKAVTVPEEITSPFVDGGEGLHIYKPEPAGIAAINKKNYDPFSVAPEFPARGQITSVPPSTEPSSPAPAAIPMPGGLRMPAMPPTTTELVQNAAQQAAPTDGEVLTVLLSELSVAWPAVVRTEISIRNLKNATVALPLALVEDALKRGRAFFSWKQLCSWATPAAAGGSVHDDELLELPLKVIAPLFLARQRGGKTRTKAAVDASIPDLFSAAAPAGRSPGTQPPFSSARNGSGDTAQFRAPKPVAVSSDTEITGKARTGDEVRTGTDFLKRYATPNDIVGRAASFEGVVGALITLPDGLLVASHLPASMNADALAAFTPQIYSRVSQSAREYRMGELKELSFTVGTTPWRIFKVGSIFFAVFGKPDEPLPVRQLAALAVELDRKPKAQ